MFRGTTDVSLLSNVTALHTSSDSVAGISLHWLECLEIIKEMC